MGPPPGMERRATRGDGWGAMVGAVVWSRYSAENYGVSEGGARLTETLDAGWRAALATVGGAPMVVGSDGAGAVHYAEVEILVLMQSALMFIGVGRPGLDVEQADADETGEFWGLNSEDETGEFPEATRWDGQQGFGQGNTMGLMHAGQPTTWSGMQGYDEGDTMGLLLDCGAGRLVVYKNGARLGVAVTGLTGELCWAVAMNRQGDSVRIMGKPPPALQ